MRLTAQQVKALMKPKSKYNNVKTVVDGINITSSGECILFFQIKTVLNLNPIREYRFHSIRRWRFDFALPDLMMAFEVEGGAYSNGRHSRGNGFEADCEKYNEAIRMGWSVYRFTTGQVKRGEAIKFISELMNESNKYAESN